MKLIFSTILLVISFSLYGNNILKIYIDADRTGVKTSGLAIEQGIKTALDEVDYQVGIYNIEVVIRDHHGNSRRSLKHLKEYVKDPDAIVIFSGLHSPPVLSNLKYINDNKVVLLDPWAAAGPITRSVDKDGNNWVFRLSVDDNYAGEVITKNAVDKEGFKKPVLLLEDTGWGSSNNKTMNTALNIRGIKALKVFRFQWGIKDNGAKEILNDIFNYGADVIFFVGNSPEGKTFVKAMSERDLLSRLPIRSHWGITGGNFFESLGEDVLVNKVDLKFIQTSFTFLTPTLNALQSSVLERAIKLFPDIKSAKDIKAPNGFVHAYDLTKIFIEALNNIELTGNIVADRELLRSSLESVKGPVDGLIKSYSYPFKVYNEKNRDSHEALTLSDFKMAEYRYDGAIIIKDY